MGQPNSIPACGLMPTSMAELFRNDSQTPVVTSIIKLINKTTARRTLSVWLNSGGIRTPILPENFQLKAKSMASDDAKIVLRKGDALEGVCDTADAVSYLIS